MYIAKYITTAVILTSIFGEIDQKWIIYVGGIISILLTLSIGLWLVRDKKEKGKWYGSTDYVWFCVAHRNRWRHLFLFGRQKRYTYSLECEFSKFIPGNFLLVIGFVFITRYIYCINLPSIVLTPCKVVGTFLFVSSMWNVLWNTPKPGGSFCARHLIISLKWKK